jgi:ABC-type bacteriocin/lantibiotic exporter with double-glycine peptidase domain
VCLQETKFARLNQYLGLIPQVVSMLTNSAVTILGVYLVMQGQFTIGMVMAFQGFLASFMAPAQQLISAGQQLQEMRTEMERIEDVMRYPSDAVHGSQSADEDEAYAKLSGEIEMKNVTFGYSRSTGPLIEDFSLSLAPGQRVALVGGSGSGKSTIAKLIVGIHAPWSGDVLFDGKAIGEIPRAVFKGSLTMVDQQVALFHDTIENNIKMWDDSIEDYEMVVSARDAGIHHQITSRKGGYQAMVEQGGRNLSGGQRQRLTIARALVANPDILILDDSASALDYATDLKLRRAIAAMDPAPTTVIVSQRAASIRHADRILVLDDGELVAQGTHDELLTSCEVYREIYYSQFSKEEA